MKIKSGVLVVAALSIVAAAFLHELGHAVAGWIQGIPSVPTPMKVYPLDPEMRWDQEIWVLFGGVAATLVLSIGGLVWYVRQSHRYEDAVLSSIFLGPLAYSIRFLLSGRGHDDVEWQATQISMGLSPTGHLLDYLFLFLVISAIVMWVVRKRASLRVRTFICLAALAVCGFVFLVGLQNLNNRIFDKQFPESRTLDRPKDLDPR